MHERAPVGAAAARLLQQIDPSDPPSTVAVGIAPDVYREIARDAWSAATADTPLEAVPVEWIIRYPVLVCLDCGTEYEGEKLDRCPSCGGNGLIVEDVPIAEVLAWES